MLHRRYRRPARLLAGLTLAATALTVAPSPAGAEAGSGSEVFINELHYDNTGTDEGEFVEIAGPAGTDLTGWSVVLYNGSNGTVYNTATLAATLGDDSGGYGFATIDYPANGLQNGAPDGLALVDASGGVVQFLSYEGGFTAVGGAADGVASTDIGVAEGGSDPVGLSLQLTGAGGTAGAFTWAPPAAATPGAANTGQTFSDTPPPVPDPRLNEFSVSTADDDVEYVEVTGAPATDYTAWTVLVIQGVAEAPGSPGQILDTITLGTTDAAGRLLMELASDRVENDPLTLVLVKDLTATVGTDLDPGDDGTFDTTPWSALADAVSIQFGAGVPYAATVLDPTFDDATYTGASAGFAPGGASRLPDTSGPWVRNDFDLNPIRPGTPEPGEAANTPGTANAAVVVPPTVARIHQVQGSGPSVAVTGTVTVQGVVTSIFDNNDVRDAFFVQEEDSDADADPATSEGIFVFCRANTVNPAGCPTGVQSGDLVTVTGQANEFFDMSQISANVAGGSITVVSSGNPLPTPVPVNLPAAGPTNVAATFEAVEGMLVTFPDTLSVTEYFQLARYGEVVLAAGGRPYQFTATDAPSPAGYGAFLTALASRRIILDDDNNNQNDMVSGPDANEPYPYPSPGLSTTNRFRGGDTISGLTGVLHWSFAGQSGTDAWRVRPVAGQDYTFTSVNPAPAGPPAVGGTLKVASFNVLNYFATLEVPGAVCGPSNLECRGANTAEELARQRAKIVDAMRLLDADVLGLIEIQNDDGASVADLVDGLNAATAPGTYTYVDTGTIGTDAIKTAFVYKPAAVTPVGTTAVLTSAVDPTFIDTRNRPALIQTFEQVSDGARVTIALNHLKSKGSSCEDIGDPDLADGQANCNQTRVSAAVALANYLATDPTGSGDADVLIMGDLNAYAQEDPITALQAAGYIDMVERSNGPGAYSFLFDGQLGYLDHALANASLAPQITGAAEWHINADEVPLFDYNDEILSAGESSFERESDALPLYAPDPLRSSDHDPLLVGLDLTPAEPVLSCGPVSGTRTQLEAAGWNVIEGTDANQSLTGTAGRDLILGRGGRDLINGRDGDDVICGGPGLDVLNGGNGNDHILGEDGVDIVTGGGGNDILEGGADVDTLFGENGDDTVSGGEGSDVVSGGNGNDRLSGDGGNDALSGDGGDDELDGGTGNDLMFGGAGADQLRGGDGDDRLSGSGGVDVCDGGPQIRADTADRTCEAIVGVP